MFNAYIVATVSGRYMVPVVEKIYKTHTGAQNAMVKYMNKNPNAKNIKVLIADNWHE